MGARARSTSSVGPGCMPSDPSYEDESGIYGKIARRYTMRGLIERSYRR